MNQSKKHFIKMIIVLRFLLLVFLLLIILLPLIIIALIILIDDGKPVLIWSKRVGLQNTYFYMPKFRTMKLDTPDLASHLLKNPKKYMTNSANILRKFSLDELPQIYCLFNGTMNIIGPRPALHNQYDLIDLRNQKNINNMKPGITGYAQINGRDNISISKKIEYDYYYYKNKSILLDFKIILLTIFKVILKKNVQH